MGRPGMALILAGSLLLAPAADAARVPLAVRADRLFLSIEVNGQPIEALLDSAAESSLIDPSLAGDLKLAVSGQAAVRGSGGEQVARFAHVSVQVASLRLTDVTVAVVDLGDVSRRL